MNLKKSPKANLENKKNIFFLLGLVFALCVTFLAFEWNTKPKKITLSGSVQMPDIEEDIIIPITREQEIQTPPPPPQIIESFSIVDDDIKIEDNLIIEDTETDNRMIIDIAMVVQTQEKEAEEIEVFSIVENMPEFPGGELALHRFITNTVKYPLIAMENGIQGKVYVTFVVERDGSVSNIKIFKGVDPLLDNEALRVMRMLPKWKPGTQGGKTVRVSYNVPINFVFN
ncbi:MAG: energy transducer TonB [Bacteroidales bacterium]|jgi:protein TonB|nr:energy transducer TonB [Bacteroidales bacterium]